MAKTDEKVMKMVEKELEKNPDISVSDLFEKAKKVSSDIGELTNRQFHARYPLQVKRRKAMKSGGKKKTAAPKRRKKRTSTSRKKTVSAGTASDANREAVRGEFLSFASDLTAAEARKDLVKVLANVDRYVDRVLKTTSK